MRHARVLAVLLAAFAVGCSQSTNKPKPGSGGTTSGSSGSTGTSSTSGSTSGTTTSTTTGGSSGSSGTTGGGPCALTSDCTGTQVCIAGTCGDPGSVVLGGSCTASRDCQGGLYCSPINQCAPGGLPDAGDGASCTSDGDCAAGLRCIYTGFTGACGAGGSGEAGSTCTAQSDCLAGLFCSSGAGGTARTCQAFATAFPAYQGPTCTDDTGAVKAYFEVPRGGTYPSDFFRLPYPNDIRVTADDAGARALDLSDFPTPGVGIADLDVVALYRDALVADFDGFSTVAPATFRFSGVVDVGTIGSNVQIVDLTDPTNTAAFFYEFSYLINATHYSCENRLTVGPGEASPLRGGHTYAVLLKSGIAISDGGAVQASPDLLLMLANSAPSDTSLQHAYDSYAPLRAWMATNSIAASSIIDAAVFTVASPQAPMAAVAQAVSAEPAPAISDLALCGVGTSSCDALGADHACSPSDAGFYELHGRMHLPIFQQGTEPYATPSEGGGITYDGGVAVKHRDEDVCFALTVPIGTAPDGGWPLLVTHHGTGGSMTNFISTGVAAALTGATTPMATLGFDAVEHADRRGGSTENPNNLVFNVVNPRAARDNFLQGAADILGAVKLATEVVDATDGGMPGPVAFDSTKVIFFGHSQGSTSGELALPFLDTVPTAVLSGASAHLTQSLLNKTSPIDAKAGIATLIQEDPSLLDTEHPVLGLFQNYFDRSDPINANPSILHAPLAGHIAHNVFMTWGTGDTFTPLQTLQANADSLGIPLVGTRLEGNFSSPVSRPVSGNINASNGSTVTGAMVQYTKATGSDGHFVAFEVPGAVADWTQWIQSDLASGQPSLQ